MINEQKFCLVYEMVYHNYDNFMIDQTIRDLVQNKKIISKIKFESELNDIDLQIVNLTILLLTPLIFYDVSDFLDS